MAAENFHKKRTLWKHGRHGPTSIMRYPPNGNKPRVAYAVESQPDVARRTFLRHSRAFSRSIADKSVPRVCRTELDGHENQQGWTNKSHGLNRCRRITQCDDLVEIGTLMFMRIITCIQPVHEGGSRLGLSSKLPSHFEKQTAKSGASLSKFVFFF